MAQDRVLRVAHEEVASEQALSEGGPARVDERARPVKVGPLEVGLDWVERRGGPIEQELRDEVLREASGKWSSADAPPQAAATEA